MFWKLTLGPIHDVLCSFIKYNRMWYMCTLNDIRMHTVYLWSYYSIVCDTQLLKFSSINYSVNYCFLPSESDGGSNQFLTKILCSSACKLYKILISFIWISDCLELATSFNMHQMRDVKVEIYNYDLRMS